jgi:hypothetical protein
VTDEGVTARRTIEVRCESCRAVVSTRHAWDTVTCTCGQLTVSGRPWRPTIAWLAAPGGGWTETTHDLAVGADDRDADGDGDVPPNPVAQRPIGYRPSSAT